MKEDAEAGHGLLSTEADNHQFLERPSTLYRSTSRLRVGAIVTCLCVSLFFNAVLYFQNSELKSSRESCVSRYTGLALEEPVMYDRHSAYAATTNLSETLQAWEALDTSPNVVALTDEYAVEHDIPVSPSRFPWDDSKGLYHIKAYHHIHCLKNIFRSVFESTTGKTPTISSDHVFHCIDALRQDILCFADDTPMPEGTVPNEIGHDQVRQCKDLGKLEAWTQNPERNACFRKLTDYGKIYHTLEAFDYCPPDSPYREVADQYFAEFGHKDPFAP